MKIVLSPSKTKTITTVGNDGARGIGGFEQGSGEIAG